jgi:superfamily II DNA or RNA helicase
MSDATYDEWLRSKKTIDPCTGLTKIPELNPMLFDFQKDIVKWALKRGRACIFADCGMGKTPMQLEWAKHVPGDVLIFAPLAVSEQTIGEGEKFGVHVEYSGDGIKRGKVTITNYERMEKFNPSDYNAVILDESSIIKSYNGKYRTELIDKWSVVPYRLACTATPAPNDFMELGNHAEFIGAMKRTEMLSMFFIHDGGETSKWVLHGHAEDKFWEWVCSWAVMIQKPSDLGYSDGGFILPKLNIKNITIKILEAAEGFLFPMEAQTLGERQRARRESIDARSKELAKIVNNSKDQWVIWVNLNDEGDTITNMIPGAVQVSGSDSNEKKIKAIHEFLEGNTRVLVSKVSIFGYGINMQNCHNTAFLGLSDSYEDFYQAVRRNWRFGQKNEVNCYIVTAETEGAVVQNIKRKEKDAEKMARKMVKNMQALNEQNIKGIVRTKTGYDPSIEMIIPSWIYTKEY